MNVRVTFLTDSESRAKDLFNNIGYTVSALVVHENEMKQVSDVSLFSGNTQKIHVQAP
jgi:hypothetical protein